VLSAISAFLASYWISQLAPLIFNNLFSLCVFVTAGVNVYAFKDLEVSPKGLAASMAALGASAGMLCLQLLRPHS